MAVAAERIMVSFEGQGAGEGELSWCQAENWSTVQALKSWLPLGGVKPLEPGTSVEDVAEELGFLMSRYPPMRTRLRFDADGRALQAVSGSGEIALEVVDAGDGDPDAVAAAVADRYLSTDLDFVAEWPLRMAVVRKDGGLTHMVVFMSHITVDGVGAAIMMREVAERVATPVPALQPLAQAQWQQSAAGQRQNVAALRYYEGILRTIDPRRFTGHGDGERPRYRQGELESPALLSAVRAIQRSTGVESTTILIALFAAAFDQVTGINPVVLRPIVGNRFRNGLSDVVCTLAQAGMLVLDVARDSFDDTLNAARRSVMSAYKHAYFDQGAMPALRDRVAEERGTYVDVRCFFNDRRRDVRRSADADPDPAGADPSPAEPVRPGTFRWLTAREDPEYEPLFVTIEDAPDAVRVVIALDTCFVSTAEGEAIAWAMEALASARVVAG